MPGWLITIFLSLIGPMTFTPVVQAAANDFYGNAGPAKIQKCYPLDLVFLIDQSNSMKGNAFKMLMTYSTIGYTRLTMH